MASGGCGFCLLRFHIFARFDSNASTLGDAPAPVVMAHEQRKRGAAAPAEEPEAPTRAKRGRVSAPAPSQRDASAAKREKFDEGKAHRLEPEEVIDVDDEDDDDVDPKDAD